MLLRIQKPGLKNNHSPGLHCLQLTFSQRNVLIETFKLYVPSRKALANNESFFQKLDNKCFKSDAKEKRNFKIKNFRSTYSYF